MHIDHASRLGEQRGQFLFGGAEAEIAYKNLRRNGGSFPANSLSA
jgi:hypothetical protein